MVTLPQAYEPDRAICPSRPGVSRWDLNRMEIEADAKLAARVGRSILAALRTNLDDALAELAVMSPAWQDGTAQEIDLSHLQSFNI